MNPVVHLAKLTNFAQVLIEKVRFTNLNWDVSSTRSYVQLELVRVDKV